MTIIHWFLLIGSLLLARGLLETSLSRLPVTSSIVYLAVGVLLGPTVLGLFSFDPTEQSTLLEYLTEIAVLISLFSAGVKMPVPIVLNRWSPAIRMAWLSMSLSVGLIAAFSYFVLGLPLGAGVLLGAILAPTDPVLATDVQVRHADDRDRLRFALTCEAGMNDGSAFPFVMLGLGLLGAHELGEYGTRWFAVDVVWATLAAIALGWIGGALLGRIGWKLRGSDPKHEVLDDLVGLGLIAVVYGLCSLISAWGFLAVFFAGVALRQTELKLCGAQTDRQGLLVPETVPEECASLTEQQEPLTVSSEALVFKEHLERLSELTLVLLLGGMVAASAFNWRTVGTALFLFFIARPLSVLLGLGWSGASMRLRYITAWFGVRGIGSMYYLMYAINHGMPASLAEEMTQITIVVIMLSILLHGSTVKPALQHFWPPDKKKADTASK
jgi:sodium/hydrogen antiporter